MKKMLPLKFLILTVATTALTACASWLGGEEIKVSPVNKMSGLMAEPRDPLYESAVTAIDERDYGRALDYLQEAKARDPKNIKVLNALGVVYDKLGRFDLSARYYAQAGAIDPNSRVVAANLGYSKALQGLMAPSQLASVTIPIDLQGNLTATGEPTVVSSPPANVGAVALLGKNVGTVVSPPAVLPAVPRSASTRNSETSPRLVRAATMLVREPMRVAQVALESTAATETSGGPKADVIVSPSVAPTKLAVEKPGNVALPKSSVSTLARPAVKVSTGDIAAGALEKAFIPDVLQVLQPKPIAERPVAEKRAASLPAVPALARPLERGMTVAIGKKVLLIGQPVRILNASGKPDRVGIVSRQLGALGWTVRLTDTGRIQAVTTLVYNKRNIVAAKAMERTVPFPVRLVAESGASGMRLIVGRDYLSWKPQNVRIRALWQKGPAGSSVRLASVNGVR